MNHLPVSIVASILLLGTALLQAAEKAVQPPYSWRGIAGSGVFPAGDLVTEFWDVPAESGLTAEMLQKARQPAVIQPGTRSNIVWRTTLPHWGNNVPVVMGDKVFLMTEEGWKDDAPQLVCLSVIDGNILWQRSVDHLDAWPADKRAEAKKMRAAELKRWREHMTWWHRFHGDPETGAIRKPTQEHWDRMLTEARAAGWEFGSYEKTPFAHDSNNFWRGRLGVSLGKSGGRSMDPSLIRNYERCHKERIYWRQDWTSESTWYGSTMGSVVGDGKRVYAVTGMGGAAVHDLDGRLLWVADLGLNPKGHPTHRNMASPVLADDALVYYDHSGGTMVAVDTATGRVRWRATGVQGKIQNPNAPGMIDGPRGNAGHMAPGGTPVVMRLGGQTVVVSNHGWVVRASDGKFLGQVKVPQGKAGTLVYSSTYFSWTAQDDVLYAGAFDPVPAALRLRIVNDAVESEVLWTADLPGDNRLSNYTLFGGKLYAPAGGGDSRVAAFDLATGKPTGASVRAITSYVTTAAFCPDAFVGIGSLNLKPKGDVVQSFVTASMPDLKPTGFGLLVAPPATGELRERHVAFLGMWELHWTSRAVVCWGNRIFVRNHDYLWCIGDPQKPWRTPEQYLTQRNPEE